MPKCFVISPFGRPGTEERAAADKVLAVIRAALERDDFVIEDDNRIRDAGERSQLRVERADESAAKFGNVMERVALSIVNDDLVVAVLWRRNPNVYYELAIAHAAARPVVILKHVDEDVPFDVLGQHVIEFDFARIDQGDDAYGKQLVADLHSTAIEARRTFEEKLRSHTQIAFGSDMLDPLGRQHNRYVVHERFTQFKYDDWSKGINEAESFIRFAGVSLFDLTRIDNNQFRFPDTSKTHLLDLLLVRILLAGLDVHVMLMDESNPGLEHMLHRGANSLGLKLGVDFAAMFLEHVRQEIEVSTLRWTEFATRISAALERTRGHPWPDEYLQVAGVRGIPNKKGGLRVTKIKSGILYSRLSMTDREAIITPFFFEFGRNGSGPAVHTRAGTPLYNAHLNDFDYLVRANEPEARTRQSERRSG